MARSPMRQARRASFAASWTRITPRWCVLRYELSDLRHHLTLWTVCALAEMSGAQSGVAVNEECGAKFLLLKRKQQFKFITFRIEDGGKSIVLDKDGPPNVRVLFSSSPKANPRSARCWDFTGGPEFSEAGAEA